VIVVVLGPRVEAPRDELDAAVVSHDRCRRRVAEPDAVGGDDVQAVSSGIDCVRVQVHVGARPDVLILAEDLDALVPVQCTNDLRVHPRDR
jgi:hypothetical protein